MSGNKSPFDRQDAASAGQASNAYRASDAPATTDSSAGTAASQDLPTGAAKGNTEARTAPRMLTRICIGLAVVLVIGLFLSRGFAQQFDHSIINVMTLIFGFFAWLSLTVALASSRLPRWIWRSVALTPVVIILVGLSLYRVARIDAELVPVFESRWKTSAPLVTESSGEQVAALPAALWQPRDTDFPQYLGPDRNGVISNVQLETDWSTNPPEILWKQTIGSGWSGFAVQGDAAVTLEQREKEQWVSCYEVESGRMLWHVAVPGYHFNALGGAGPRSTPTIADDRVYAHLVTGPLVCLELASGEKVWEVDLLQLGGWDQDAAEKVVSWGRSGSPLIVRDMVVVPLGGTEAQKNSLIALRRSDGQIVWRAGKDQIGYSSPVLMNLLGVEQIVMVNEQTITGHDIETGDELWTVPWEGQSNGAANTSQPVWVDQSHLLFSKGYLKGSELVQFSLDADGKWSHNVVWKEKKAMKTKLTSAIYRDGYAYGLSDGILECIRVSDGKQQWKKGHYRHGQVLLVGDVLLITAENGALALVAADPARFQELAKRDVLGDVTWNPPALSGDRLLMRNADEAACLRLPLKTNR